MPSAPRSKSHAKLGREKKWYLRGYCAGRFKLVYRFQSISDCRKWWPNDKCYKINIIYGLQFSASFLFSFFCTLIWSPCVAPFMYGQSKERNTVYLPLCNEIHVFCVSIRYNLGAKRPVYPNMSGPRTRYWHVPFIKSTPAIVSLIIYLNRSKMYAHGLHFRWLHFRLAK